MDNTPREAVLWRDLCWWLLSASVLSIVASICVAFLMQLIAWGGFAVLIALGSLPFAGEAWIQFRSWWRRLLWLAAGIVTGILVVRLEMPWGNSILQAAKWPDWLRAVVPYVIPAFIEFFTASGRRKRPWVWLFVTPSIFGLYRYWMEPVLLIAEGARRLFNANVSIANGPAPDFYDGAAIFGTVLFTLALTGSLVASRKPA